VFPIIKNIGSVVTDP